jgi:DNA-binding NarL/FixJ family response regulator
MATALPASDCTVALVSTRPAIRTLVRYALDPTIWAGVRSLADLGAASTTTPEPIVLVDLDDVALHLGVEAARTTCPDARIVALAGSTSGATVLDALRAGVRGYVRMPDELMKLGDVLDRVARGEVVVRVDLQRAAVQELGRLVRRVREGADVEAQLTPREHQILGMLADGLTARQIGSRLSISPRTVEHHANGVYRKLDVRTRVQAVARAAAIGLVNVR